MLSLFTRKHRAVLFVFLTCTMTAAVKFGPAALARGTNTTLERATAATNADRHKDGPATSPSSFGFINSALEDISLQRSTTSFLSPTALDPSATITVNDPTDTIHSPGCATTGTGTCSLRDAILFTNTATAAAGGTNTIILGPGTFNLSITGSGENLAATGDLDILAPPTGFVNTISINGAGASSTIIQWSPAVPAASRDRIFDAHPNAPPNGSITLSITGITFTGGNSVTSSGGVMLTGRPGDITNLTDSVFDSNTAFTNGGAISQSSSAATHDLNITNCVFNNNLAGGGGGAVNYSGLGTVTITGSTFSNNRTGPVGANTGGSGGALSTSGGGNGGTYNVSRNAFINNQVLNATAQGGAVVNTNGTLNISFNRFRGNTVPAPANGITLAQTGGATVNVINANDNWWGQNSGPVANDAVVLAAGGTINLTTWLQLRNTPASATIVTGQTTTISADIRGLSTGGSTAAANLVGLPTFPASSSTIFSLPVRGNLSATNGQFVNGIANLTPTFTPTSVGAGSTSATADNQTIAGPITINKANTTTGVTSSQNPSLTGQTVTFTATVAVTAPGAGTPTGTVNFLDGGVSITGCSAVALSGNTAQCMTSALTAASHTITAVYGGDANFNVSPAGSMTGNPQVVGNTAVWDGSASSDWNTAANWATNFVPLATHSIDLPSAGVTNQPNLSAGDTTVVNLAVGTGRTLTIGGNRTLTINGTLTMNGNNIDATAGTLEIATGAGVIRTSGLVLGRMKKNFINGNFTDEAQLAPEAIFTFPVGTATGFSPVTANVTAGSTGSLTVQAIDGTAPSTPALNDATTLDRYWQLAETGDLTAGLTFNYLQTDVDGIEANYRMIRSSAGAPPIRFPNGTPCPGAGSPCVDGTSPTGGTIFVNPVASFENFWTAGEPLAPTAAGVSISGRVLTADGRGVTNAKIVVTGNTLVEPRYAQTSTFGYYTIEGLRAGETYVVTVNSKRFVFSMPSHVVTVLDNVTDLDFTASPE